MDIVSANFAVGFFTAFAVSVIACGALRRLADKYALHDLPNERSLHTKPVPRLGGVGVVIGVFASLSVWFFVDSREPSIDIVSWALAGAAIATLGFLDDLKGLRAGVRLLAQLATSGAFLLMVGAPTELSLGLGDHWSLPTFAAMSMWTLWIVGVVNIYNFMDGMDGLASIQAICAALSLAVVMATNQQLTMAAVMVAMFGASAGFLVHNYPPAKMFLGDAGSTFIGFTFAACAIVGAKSSPGISVTVVPLAISPFLVDGTFTIMRRLSRRERIWEPHRTHVYQRAVGSGLSHKQVLLRFMAWCSVAAAACVFLTPIGGWAVIAAWLSTIAMFLVIWRWVVYREQRLNPRHTTPKVLLNS